MVKLYESPCLPYLNIMNKFRFLVGDPSDHKYYDVGRATVDV